MGEDLMASDHDLLIKLDQKLTNIEQELKNIGPAIQAINIHLADLDDSRSRHSERLQSIKGEVLSLKQDKLNKEEIAAVREDVEELKKKSNAWDILNSIGIALMALLEMIFRR